MSQQKKGKAEFDTSSAIKEIEEKKEAQRLKRVMREKEKLRLKKEEEEGERLAEQERRLRFFEDERYFRLSLVDSIVTLSQEVEQLRKSMESIKEMTEDAIELAVCLGDSDHHGLDKIRFKYKGYS